MQRSILIQALSTSSATESLVPGRAPPTPPRSLDPNTLIMEDSVLYNITIDDLNIHEIFEHSLATMIRNRRDLIKEIFSILAPHEIKTMLPTPISCMKPKEVMKLCYMQLKEMPEAHLVAILTHLANPQQASITYYKPSNMKTKSIKKITRIAKSPSKSASPVHKTKKSSSKSPQTNIIGNKSPSYRSTEYFTSFSSPSKKRKAQSKSTFTPEKSKRQQSSPQFWDTSFDYSPQKIPPSSQETSHHRFDRNKRNSAPKMCSSPFTSTNYESISKDRYDNTYSYRRSRSSSPNLNDQTSVQDNTLPRYYNTNVKNSTTDTKHSPKISSGTKKTSSAISKYSPTYRPHIATTSTHQKSSRKLQSSSSNNKVYTSLGSKKAITSTIKKHKKVFSTHRDFTTTTSSISSDRYRISPKKSSFSEKKSLSFDYFEKEVKSKDKDNRKRLTSTVVNTSREYDQNKKSKK